MAMQPITRPPKTPPVSLPTLSINVPCMGPLALGPALHAGLTSARMLNYPMFQVVAKADRETLIQGHIPLMLFNAKYGSKDIQIRDEYGDWVGDWEAAIAALTRWMAHPSIAGDLTMREVWTAQAFPDDVLTTLPTLIGE
jgi:hypothetical protein